MRIVLIDPATRYATITPYENLGLAYLAATLRQRGHEVRIISAAHENLSTPRITTAVLKINPALVGITVLGANAQRAMQLVHRLRERGYRGHLTLGGYFPTFHALELMRGFPAIDSVVRNEGEITLTDLVEHLPDGDLSGVAGLTFRDGAEVRENPQRPFTKTIDELPFPARDFTAHVLSKGSYIHVSTSRGCYANCSFCAIAKFFRMGNGKVWRRRSAESLAEEIQLLARQFRFNRFKFVDDQFILTNKEGHDFAEAFNRELDRRNLKIGFQIACRANNVDRNLFQRLKQLGLEKVFVGVESGHERGLDTFNKETSVAMNDQALATLRELEISYDVGFILIDPYTTYEELKQNLQYLLRQKAQLRRRDSFLSVTTSLVAYSGTPIYDRLVQERRLLGDYLTGFYYQIADAEVRRFRFLMESLFERVVLQAFHHLLFRWNDLRLLWRNRFLNNHKKSPTNLVLKGGEVRENGFSAGVRVPHAAGVE